ncbi:MAG: hypothetical protein ACRDU8_05420 [Egibacteraceae bacterium]
MRVLAAALALTAVACTGAAAGGTGQPAVSARVGLIEWEITTSTPVLAHGKASLTVANAGTTAHDLRVSGAGVDAATPALAPGERAVLSFEVDAGDELVLWCTIPGHREQGMLRRLPIAD